MNPGREYTFPSGLVSAAPTSRPNVAWGASPRQRLARVRRQRDVTRRGDVRRRRSTGHSRRSCPPTIQESARAFLKNERISREVSCPQFLMRFEKRSVESVERGATASSSIVIDRTPRQRTRGHTLHSQIQHGVCSKRDGRRLLASETDSAVCSRRKT